MPRRHALVLAGLAWLALSPAPRSPNPALPAVSAPPPAVAPRAPGPDAPADRAARMRRVRERLGDHHTGLAPHEVQALAATIADEAARQDLPLDLVLAVMHVESRYDVFAVSPVGALGLMQVMPATGQELAGDLGIPWSGPRTLFDPHVNVRLGMAYLKWLERRYERIDVALAAYNWGPGAVDRRLRAGRPVPAGYARDVLAVYGARGRS